MTCLMRQYNHRLGGDDLTPSLSKDEVLARRTKGTA